MIPEFDERGYLPPGVHPATMEEIEARFGVESEIRRVIFESIVWMVDLARVAGIRRIVLDGSFTTDRREPNDVDCALMAEPGDIVDHDAVLELTESLPFVDAKVFDSEEFEPFLHSFFAFDRRHREKGMIEVISWNPG